MLSAATVEALLKEWEDAIGVAEDARREAEKEWLVAATAENMCDAAQAQVARLRQSLKVRVVPFLHLCAPWTADSRPRSRIVLVFQTFVGEELREEAHRLGEQLQRLQEEAGRLQAHLDAHGAESQELWDHGPGHLPCPLP